MTDPTPTPEQITEIVSKAEKFLATYSHDACKTIGLAYRNEWEVSATLVALAAQLAEPQQRDMRMYRLGLTRAQGGKP